MNSLHQIKYRGYVIHIHADDSPESPRDWDNLGKFYCCHSRYSLGDEQIDDPETFLGELAGLDFDDEFGNRLHRVWDWVTTRYGRGWETGVVFDYYTIETAARARFDKLVKAALEEFIILPLYLYDHSGITISCHPFSCSWDSGQVGYAVLTKQEIDSEFGGDREKAEAYLRATVKTYDDYLTGSVYGYTIEPADDNEDKIEDSCWGYYLDEDENYWDDDSYIAREAKEVIDHRLANIPPDGDQHDSELDLAGFHH